jgi:hypothetical protein
MTERNVDWTHSCGLEMRSFGDIFRNQKNGRTRNMLKELFFGM